MKPNYYYITSTLLFILGLIIGYFICAYFVRKQQRSATSSEINAVRQTYLAELSKEEASRQTFYAELSAEKERLDALVDSVQNSKILGLRTTIYQVHDLEKASI